MLSNQTNAIASLHNNGGDTNGISPDTKKQASSFSRQISLVLDFGEDKKELIRGVEVFVSKN